MCAREIFSLWLHASSEILNGRKISNHRAGAEVKTVGRNLAAPKFPNSRPDRPNTRSSPARPTLTRRPLVAKNFHIQLNHCEAITCTCRPFKYCWKNLRNSNTTIASKHTNNPPTTLKSSLSRHINERRNSNSIRSQQAASHTSNDGGNWQWRRTDGLVKVLRSRT